MQIKCEYCGQYIDDSLAKCPYCGAANHNMQRAASGVPKTIDELLLWCHSRHMPLEQMRFFIGVDYRGPRAFGIYKDLNTGNFIVYKNKDDGTRAIRYQGTDEDYAVNELYQKIKEETLNQAQLGNIQRYQPDNPYTTPERYDNRRRKRSSRIGRSFTVLFVTIISSLVIMGLVVPAFIYGISLVPLSSAFDTSDEYGRDMDAGYYQDDTDDIYYNDYGTWYAYSKETDEWTLTSAVTHIDESHHLGSLYEVSLQGIDFRTSGYRDPDDSNYYDYGGQWYVYYDREFTWYRLLNGKWVEEYDSNVPFELKRFYKNYQTTDWDNGTYPDGVPDFRLTSYYKAEEGYYTIDGIKYYNHYGDWYKYTGSDYVRTSEPDYRNSTETYNMFRPADMEDFYDSDAYNNGSNYDDSDSSTDWSSDWDSGSSSYDYSGWDSGSTDWSSDW